MMSLTAPGRTVSWLSKCFGCVPLFVHKCSVSCVTCRCCVSLFPCIHQPGAWRDSLGTDVNKLFLRKSQTQNVCEHDCIQSHMSLLVFHPVMFPPRNDGDLHFSLMYGDNKSADMACLFL